jgi:hypothetical protein
MECLPPDTMDQQLIVILQEKIVNLRLQIELKDKQILQQGLTIKRLQKEAAQ